MKSALRLVLTVGLLLAGTLSALAAGLTPQVKLWDTQARLPIPEGFCLLSDDQPMDHEILENVRRFNEGRNEVLAMFAACGELQDFRTQGVALTNFGSYLAGLSAQGKPVSMARAAFVKMLADHLRSNDPLATAAQDIQDRAARIGAVVQKNQMVSLGLLTQDEAAVYTGLLLPNVAEGAGPDERDMVVTGITLLHGHPVSVNLSTAYSGENTLAPLLAAQQRLLRSLVAAN